MRALILCAALTVASTLLPMTAPAQIKTTPGGAGPHLPGGLGGLPPGGAIGGGVTALPAGSSLGSSPPPPIAEQPKFEVECEPNENYGKPGHEGERKDICHSKP